MRFVFSAIAFLAASSTVTALPARRADGPSDTDILNYALTLGKFWIDLTVELC